MKKLLIILAILIPPIGLIYLFAAINLSLGYRKMYCSGGAAPPTFRTKLIEKLDSKGIPVPAWLSKTPKSCNVEP